MEHGTAIERMIEHSRSIRRRAFVRVLIVAGLITMWIVAAATGIFLMTGPWGDIEPGNVQFFEAIVLGMNRRQWGALHLGITVLAIAVSITHFAMEWRPFRGSLRQVVSRPKVSMLHGTMPPTPAARKHPAPRRPLPPERPGQG